MAGDLSDLRQIIIVALFNQNDIIAIYKKTSQRYFDFTQSLSSSLVGKWKLNVTGTGSTANESGQVIHILKVQCLILEYTIKHSAVVKLIPCTII